MNRLTNVVWLLLVIAAPAGAGVINGVASITTGLNNTTPGLGRTVLANTGTVLDGLYGTENLAYLVDDFPGSLGYDGLIIKATAVVNDEGTVSGADNSAILGYSNPAIGHRSETNFGISLYHPGDGRIFIMAGGNLFGSVGNWADVFGRNNPFDIDLVASLAGNTLTVTGSLTDADAPATQILVNQMITVDPATQSSAFGTSSGFEQVGVQRNYGVDFSNVMYSSTVVIPEPATMSLALVAVLATVRRRRPGASRVRIT
ncbi:MAG: hypothetical protein WD851_04590 [Pirellulales bacterium]